MLVVNSNEIVFNLENDLYRPFVLEVRNTTSKFVAYKVLLGLFDQECFAVKPGRGILSPYQAESIEFSTNAHRKNTEPKHLVNQKFQIVGITLQEKKSFAEIDQLMKTEENYTIKLQTVVYKHENGQQIQIQNQKLVQSVYQSNGRLDHSSQLLSTVGGETRIEDLAKNIASMESEIRSLKTKREQLFMTIQQGKTKKGGSMAAFIVALVLGVAASQAYQYFVGLY